MTQRAAWGSGSLYLKESYETREGDWRCGAVVYQVLVDRFACGTALKSGLYAPPRRLRGLHETPKKGEERNYKVSIGGQELAATLWSHELDFWGGDLRGLLEKLDWIVGLGCEVLYLNPIFDALSNHKYDTRDYSLIAPEYGTIDEFKELAGAVHMNHMHLVLDGVFNHVGRLHPWFQEALKDKGSAKRELFFMNPEQQGEETECRYWTNARNLPEINLESALAQEAIFGGEDSVLQRYLKDGADGWRLDVAFEMPFHILRSLSETAHRSKPGSLVLGEVFNYPEEWGGALDGILNAHLRTIIIGVVQGRISGARGARLIQGMVDDCGLEFLLRSWVILDNHDLPRLKSLVPLQWQQRIAQMIQFCAPGSPCVYYGSELGMKGETDPLNRAPMRWDLTTNDNPDLQFMKRLIHIRKGSRALRIGEYRMLDSEQVFAFMRLTDRVEDTRVLIANLTNEAICETIPIRDPRIMPQTPMAILVDSGGGLSDDSEQIAEAVVHSGTLRFTLAAQTALLLRPKIDHPENLIIYTNYKAMI